MRSANGMMVHQKTAGYGDMLNGAQVSASLEFSARSAIRNVKEYVFVLVTAGVTRRALTAAEK